MSNYYNNIILYYNNTIAIVLGTCVLFRLPLLSDSTR